MSEPKLNIKEETSTKKTRSPPKKAKVEQSVPRKKKLKTDAEKTAEKAQHLRFGKAELTPDELSRLSKAQKREMYAAHAARSAVHREVDQYEDDNVGTQALSEGEKAAENVRDISKSHYARKLKKKAKMQGKKGARTAKSSVQNPTAAQDAGASGTGEGGSNWLSRWRQKQDIRQSYYAAARSGTAAQTAGGKAASNGASAAQSGVEQAVEKGKTAVSTAVKGLMNAAKGNAHVLVIVGVFLLLILILQKLMNRPDVDSIVNSCDSGREGELIFRLVYQQAGCKKPFSRLWLSSMEESAIREGFAHLKPSTEYDALYNAALCRERADWMVGINASRLFSCLYNQPLAVGRVMTPVLAMTVVREAAIAAFVPEKFYTVDLELTSGCTASSKRFAQKADAELLLSKCRKEERVTVQKMERKEKSESPPQLYDLTALQRDANRLLGFTAQQTLDYAQSLYEKRLITYPRTDSRFLTEDMAASLPGLVTDTGKAFAVEEPIPIHVQQVINGSKVTDHHALLPTKSMANADLAALPAGERNVLRLISARLLCAVGEPHRYAETTLTTICAGENFSSKGKVVLSDGWKAVERKMLGELLGKQKEPIVLPDVQEQSQCSVAGAELKEGQTSPPKHFTEDTLLHAMETASADSMPEGVERQGIGTPATRAATIEKLVQKGFLERKDTKKTKVLLPTDKGKALITVMPEEIQSPEMTADWETKLLRIERGEMEPETFMTEIKEMISSLVTTTEAAKGANALMLKEGFYHRPLTVVRPIDIENFLKGMRRDGRSDSYISKARGMLYQIFQKAEANDLVRRNPVRLAEKMRASGTAKRKEAFTTAEVAHLMKVLPDDRMGLSIRLLLGTGMRMQELLALEPQFIEEDGSVIHIRQAVKVVKGTVSIGSPKSKDSIRDIPVPLNVRPCAIKLRDTTDQFIWESPKTGLPCNPTHFRDVFRKSLEEAGDVRLLTPHSCRHTYVSQMQALGVDIQTIQSIVGHADTEMTEHYLHVQESIRQSAIQLFSEAFSA